VRREHPHHVVVHDVRDENEEKNQADLDEAFLEREAEIAPANSFKRKK
jgi:hypothetical protein